MSSIMLKKLVIIIKPVGIMEYQELSFTSGKRDIRKMERKD